MKKTPFISLVIVVLVVVVGAVLYRTKTSDKATESYSPSVRNATYIIEGQPVTLVDGLSVISNDTDSASKITTQYFGNEAVGDVNADNLDDVAFILTQNTGGSGTFYYAVVALKTDMGYQGTNAILLGDRIAPQTTEIKNGQVIVNYADRNPGESMITQPSLGVSKYLGITSGILSEVNPLSGEGERCGGNAKNAPACISGFYCAPVPGSSLPFGDVGGICVTN